MAFPLIPEAGAIVYNEEDGLMYNADLYGWGRQGVDTPIRLIFTYNGADQLTIRWKAPSINTVNFNWDDGTVDAVPGNDGTTVTTVSNYSVEGTYLVYLTGDYPDITYWQTANMPNLSGSINGFRHMPLIDTIFFNNCNYYGDVASLTPLTGLTVLHGNGTLLSGELSTLSALPLTTINMNISTITFKGSPDWPIASAQLIAIGRDLTSDQVNNMLKSFKDSTSGNFNFMFNDPRTPVSDADLQELVEDGNLVVLRETAPVGTLGAELNVVADAASDPNGNEVDGVAGWTPTNLVGTGANRFESQSAIKRIGAFAILADGNDTPTAGEEFLQVFTVVAFEMHRTALWMRHIGSGGVWGFNVDGVYAGTGLLASEIKWLDVVAYSTAQDVSHEIKFTEIGPSNDGGIVVDAVSVRDVTFP